MPNRNGPGPFYFAFQVDIMYTHYYIIIIIISIILRSICVLKSMYIHICSICACLCVLSTSWRVFVWVSERRARTEYETMVITIITIIIIILWMFVSRWEIEAKVEPEWPQRLSIDCNVCVREEEEEEVVKCVFARWSRLNMCNKNDDKYEILCVFDCLCTTCKCSCSWDITAHVWYMFYSRAWLHMICDYYY